MRCLLNSQFLGETGFFEFKNYILEIRKILSHILFIIGDKNTVSHIKI